MFVWKQGESLAFLFSAQPTAAPLNSIDARIGSIPVKQR
jgi:hypothetical protein